VTYAHSAQTDREYRNEFRSVCKEYNLRTGLKEARELIAPSLKSLEGCHMFDGFNNGVGLWITATSPKKATLITKKAVKLGASIKQRSELEVSLFVKNEALFRVAKAFKIVLGNRRNDQFLKAA